MGDIFRVCAFIIPAAVTIIRKEGDPQRESFFDGTAKDSISSILSFYGRGYNVSLVEKSSTEECIQSMIRNESDGLLSATPYMGLDFDHIYPMSLYGDTKIAIFSSYNMTSPDSKRFSNIVLSLVTGLTPGVVVISIGFLMSCYFLINMATWIIVLRTRRTRTVRNPQFKLNYGFETFAHFLHQESIDFDDFLRRLLSLLLSLTSFFVLLALGAGITTDLVVLDKPKLISSYRDIIDDPSISVMSLDFIDVGKLLSSSGPGSVNDNFWQSIKMRHTAVSGSNVDMNTAAKMAPEYMDTIYQKRVGLLPDVFREGAYKGLCMTRPLVASFMEGFTAFPYYSHDPEAEPILISFIMTQSIRHTTLGKRVLKQNRWQTEAGLLLHAIEAVDVAHMVKVVLPASEKGDYYDKCMHEKVVMPDVPPTMSVKPENLKTIVYLYPLMLAIILIVYLFERRSRGKKVLTRPATVHDLRTRNSTSDGRNIIRSMSAGHEISNKCERNQSIKIETSLSTAPNSHQPKPVPRVVATVQHTMPDVDID